MLTDPNMMIVTSDGMLPMALVRPGAQVLGFDGSYRSVVGVSFATLSGPEMFVVVRFRDHTRDRVCVTPGHRFWSGYGWRSARSLEIGDTLLAFCGDNTTPAFELEKVTVMSAWLEDPPINSFAYRIDVADVGSYISGGLFHMDW